MRLGIADHFGWAVAVTAAADHRVMDRRRIALIEPGLSPAPIHYESWHLDVDATAALVARVRASVARAASAALDALATALPEPIVSISLRAWPLDFPDDIAVQRRSPYEARADAIMYRQVLAELAAARGWEVHFYTAREVEAQAISRLAERADEVLAQSDFVQLLMPATRETENFMNAERLRRMKASAWLLNLGRGQLIKDDDLVAVVKEKRIAGAILDVYREEPLPAAHPFWTTEGIIVLPHLGGPHPQRDRFVARLFVDNLARFLDGKPLKEVVDRKLGY